MLTIFFKGAKVIIKGWIQEIKKEFSNLPKYFLFIKELKEFRALDKSKRLPFSFSDVRVSFADRTADSTFEPHYTYHPAWAARIIAQTKPALHIDISSVLHFSTLISAFVPVKFYDYRPADLKLDNLQSGQADLLALPFADNSVESLSCMHVIEHVGLGRYGDKLNPDGDIQAIKELKRVLKPGGTLLFVVPVGIPRLQFHLHRIYGYEQIMEYFSDLKLKEFSLIADNWKEVGIIKNADPAIVKNYVFGCGCFWFTK
jgi:SAM-dependent methyltransferase